MPQSMAGTAVPPPVMPRDPGPEPQMPQPTRAMQYWQAAARDSSLSPTVRADAAKQYSDLSKEQKDDYVRHWTIWKGERIKADDPATALALRSSQLGVVKTMRELEGEGWEPVPADKMALLPKVAEGQTYWQDRQGNLKFGPRPPGSVNIDQKAQGAGLVKMQQEMADHIVGQFKEGTTASDDLRSIAGMRVLMSRVDTGLPAVAKQFAGRMGIKTEGISDIEALNAAIMRMVPQQRVPGTGATSDFDAHMFQASVPELMKTREGNMMIMDTMESAARNKLARSEIAGKVMSGQMEMPEGIKALLKLQMEAKSISDNVRAYVENKGIKLPSSVLPGQAEQDDAARAWLAANPNHPKAPAVRQSLGGQ
jgi:hypothetical protein